MNVSVIVDTNPGNECVASVNCLRGDVDELICRLMSEGIRQQKQNGSYSYYPPDRIVRIDIDP
jgi:hypothetical protein